MQKHRPDARRFFSGEYRSGLTVLGGAFALGGLLGCFMASWIGGAGTDGLTAYIQSFLQAAQENYASSPTWFPLIWEQTRYPLAVLILGFTALGMVAIPVLFAMRAFFLSFAISAFVRMFGGEGAILSLILFGLSGAVSVPVLFLLGTQGWQTSQTLAGRPVRRRNSEHRDTQMCLPRIALCAGCILLSAWIEHSCTLPLLIWAAGVW